MSFHMALIDGASVCMLCEVLSGIKQKIHEHVAKSKGREPSRVAVRPEIWRGDVYRVELVLEQPLHSCGWSRPCRW